MDTPTLVRDTAAQVHQSSVPATRGGQVLWWLRDHWQGTATVAGLLLFVGVVTAVNLTGYPQRFEDEGTYTAQAWAMLELLQVSHYTNWYDHPFFGWAQLAGWLQATMAFSRYGSSIAAAREFMLITRLVSCGLLYLLARRLGLRKSFAAVAVLLFGLSPLSVMFGRQVFLDNIAMPWLLAAFVLALTPRKHLGAFIGSGACMAIAVLSKETVLLLLPALIYTAWQNRDSRNWRYALTCFGISFAMLSLLYPLYAALKGELFEGPGHVSLIWAIKWQLFNRQASGSIFDPESQAHWVATVWSGRDPWLLGLGIGLIPLALIFRRLRPITLALLIQVAMMLRPGYLPVPHVIPMLPFAALAIAGVADSLWDLKLLRLSWTRQAPRVAVLVSLMVFLVAITPDWWGSLHEQMTRDADKPAREAITWIDQHIPRTETLAVDSILWLDLVNAGFPRDKVIWNYKLDTDTEVTSKISGWQEIDYIAVLTSTLNPDNRQEFPTLFKAKDHTRELVTIGPGGESITILKVNNEGVG
jgi:4-amino-4-deoxy-L-arabinose transferase-like glycosyltransferase